MFTQSKEIFSEPCDVNSIVHSMNNSDYNYLLNFMLFDAQIREKNQAFLAFNFHSSDQLQMSQSQTSTI